MILEKHYFHNTKNFHQYDGVSGIYAILYKEQVLYVGQSVNVCRRLFSHHSMRGNIKRNLAEYNATKNACAHNRVDFYRFLLDNKPFIYFIVLPTPQDKLDAVEQHYITKYKPQYNWTGVRTEFSNPVALGA